MSALEPIREVAPKREGGLEVNLSEEDRARLRRKPMFRVGE